MRVFFLLLITVASVHAQWKTETYSFQGGWNSIYLIGDASQDAIGNLFPAEVVEIWRWNSNPTQVQFTQSPQTPSGGTPEWSVWRRGFPAESEFSELNGQTAYLVKCLGTASTSIPAFDLKQTPLPPTAAWVRNGANLMGFPTFKNGLNFPTFATYFATFPAAIVSNTQIFQYVGGELGPSNPIQVFSTLGEEVDRSKAYWFSAEAVENFVGPLDIQLTNGSGLDFGRNGSIISVRTRNRSNTAVTVTLSPQASEAPPSGQTPILAPVPLTRLVFNPATLRFEPQAIAGPFTEEIPGSSTVELRFGIDRGAMAGDQDSFFASFLRLTDSGNLMDVWLPARAQNTSLDGLWIGDITVSGVESKVPGSPGSTTPRDFKLRTILHRDGSGTARLLSQVFLGQLDVAPNDVGLCSVESLLKQDAKASARRLVAAHMPLDQVITGSGSVAVPGALSCEITVPYNDPTNPFLHQYHPDHDNKDARFQDFVLPGGVTATTAKISDGVEAPAITRSCTFTFTASPPAGSEVTSGWGSSVLGGTYTETISGLHKETITVSGTFELRQASEINTLSQ